MEHCKLFEDGRIRTVSSDEIAALICPSDSEDDLQGDDFDADPTVQFEHISSASSDSDEDAQPQSTIFCPSQINTNNTIHTVDNATRRSQPGTLSQQVSGVSCAKSGKIKKITDITWNLRSNTLDTQQFTFKGNACLPHNVAQLDNPYQFFKYFFTDDLLSKIAEETNLYSCQLNPNKSTDYTIYDIQKFLGICIFNSVSVTSNVRDIWNEILGNDIVKETMSQKTFENL